uniref:cGMP-dependent protein kinase n=1 Tax=Sinocyclocheilus anshuiensis TaxID=1608454 RepID=A0A671LCP8_9TELE
MGNGSMKLNPLKQVSGSGKSKNNGESSSVSQVLRVRVEELENQLKKKDEDLNAKEIQIKHLEEQLAQQRQTISEISDTLRNKCLHLNKLQDALKNQGELGLLPSPIKENVSQCRTGLLRDTLNRRKGAKAGVSAEPSSRTYDSSGVPKFYFESARVWKEQSLNGCHSARNEEASGISLTCCFVMITAASNVKTWALDREVFHNIMRMTAEARQEQYCNFLRSVSLLASLPGDKLTKIVDCLEVEYYNKGDYIIREGEEGNTFYIIANGKIKVTQSTQDHEEPQIINTLGKGDYFGEKALISDDVRSANIITDEDGVECLVIDRETFSQTVGTFDELKKYLQSYVEILARDDKKRNAKRSGSRTTPTTPVSHDMIELKERESNFASTIPFSCLEVIATLGVGGFGRVELVKAKNENETFALKCIKKRHIVDNRQEEHIYSERRILLETNSPFIVKMYRTFKDNKYVYMLLEACLGGEIWSLLRDRGSFDEYTAKFCVGCVTEAFDYLHNNGIIYRDLKPENLMLDTDGYVKLVDFGFAKKLKCGQKTWTFCGTPEYVAPEIILNKGHGLSVDFWSLGILIFELLTGSPPFTGSDQMIIYTFILKGIEKMDFPKKITKRPGDLIRKLCRQNPSERLGNLKNGITDIKKHRWFTGFSWSGMKSRSLISPLKREVKHTFITWTEFIL